MQQLVLEDTFEKVDNIKCYFSWMISVNKDILPKFLKSENVGGILLLACVILSLAIANSDLKHHLNNFLNTNVGFGIANFTIKYSVSSWINDGLMAIFFLLVGLEIKRELVEGELSSVKKATLPVIAAIGGMAIPAVIYYLFNKNLATVTGWAIPMATDIAFALAIISLLGKRVPASLKIFLAALAIADDLGAIVVVAVFYTSEIHWNEFFIGGGIFAFLLLLNYLRVKKLVCYIIPGILLWYFIHHSGIHATIAGVLLAFTIPTNKSDDLSPLEKLEHKLLKPVNFLVMPIFAIANTNITFEDGMIDGLLSNMGLGIILGLFIGKTIGVSLLSYVAVKLRLANIPSGASWKHIIGVGMLAGIGFTMSIFISMLSFDDAFHIAEAKFAILCASLISGIVGYTFLSLQKAHENQ